MTASSRADRIRLSQNIVRFVQSEIANQQGSFPVRQTQLAESLGISRSMVKQVLSGKRVLGRRFFEQFAENREMQLPDLIDLLEEGQVVISIPQIDNSKTLNALGRMLTEMKALVERAELILENATVSQGTTKRTRKKSVRKK